MKLPVLRIHLFTIHPTIYMDKLRVFRQGSRKFNFYVDTLHARIAIWESIKRRTWVLSSVIMNNATFKNKTIGKKIIFLQVLSQSKGLTINTHNQFLQPLTFLTPHLSMAFKLKINRFCIKAYGTPVKVKIVKNYSVAMAIHGRA